MRPPRRSRWRETTPPGSAWRSTWSWPGASRPLGRASHARRPVEGSTWWSPTFRTSGMTSGTASSRRSSATSRARRSSQARTASTRSASSSRSRRRAPASPSNTPPIRPPPCAHCCATRGPAATSPAGSGLRWAPRCKAVAQLVMTSEEVAAFERCISVGGVALFPADTVYGLATGPDSREGVYRLYRLKRRDPGRPSAVMFFRLELALAALPELGERTHAAVERLLAGGPEPERLGLRVPRLQGELAPLADVSWPVLQSSANPSGGAEARRVEGVEERIRAGADLVLDGGELPGTPSTVVDLTSYEVDGGYEIVREGAVTADAVRELL